MSKLMFALMMALLLQFVTPAYAAGVGPQRKVDRPLGPGVTLLGNAQASSTPVPLRLNASTDHDGVADRLPSDLLWLEFVVATKGRTGKAAGDKDKKEMSLIMNTPAAQIDDEGDGTPRKRRRRSSNGDIILRQQNKETEKNKPEDLRWSGHMRWRCEGARLEQLFPLNRDVIIRVNTENALPPAIMVVRRVNMTLRQMLIAQEAARRGVHPDEIEQPNDDEQEMQEESDTTPDNAAPNSALVRKGALQEPDQKKFDPYAYQREQAKAKANAKTQPKQAKSKRESSQEDDEDEEEMESNNSKSSNDSEDEDNEDMEEPEDDRKPQGRRVNEPPSSNGRKPRREFPAAGELTIRLERLAGVSARALDIDVCVGGEVVEKITISGRADKAVLTIPEGNVELFLHGTDASRWITGYFTVKKVLAGYSGTWTLKEIRQR